MSQKWVSKHFCKILVSLYLILAILIVISLVNGETTRIIKTYVNTTTSGITTTSTTIGSSFTTRSTNVSFSTNTTQQFTSRATTVHSTLYQRGTSGYQNTRNSDTRTPNKARITSETKWMIHNFTKRDQLPFLLESAKFHVGAELGVQQGLFAEHILKHWPSCTKFYLIDIWAHQKNYVDGANVGDKEQDLVYRKALNRMAPFRNKTIILRNFTKDAAKLIPDGSLDFVYVDARHDYCGVMEDLTSYYPKLKPGGYMAGHDYKTAAEVRIMDRSQDWGICGDGTRNEGSVKGAVDDFMKKLGIKKLYLTDEAWTTWMFIKQ